MTVEFGDTALAPVELPPGVTGFGVAELVHLMARHDVPATEITRRVIAATITLERDPAEPGFALVQAGASSLLARGLLRQDGSSFLPTGEAALFEYAVAAGQRWVQITMIADRGPEVGLMIFAPSVTAILQLRALGSAFAGFRQGEVVPADLILAFVKALLQAHPEASFGIESWQIDDTQPKGVFVRFDRDSLNWDTVDQVADRDNERREALSEDALLDRLSRLAPAVPTLD